jgi:hypothetical protein
MSVDEKNSPTLLTESYALYFMTLTIGASNGTIPSRFEYATYCGLIVAIL